MVKTLDGSLELARSDAQNDAQVIRQRDAVFGRARRRRRRRIGRPSVTWHTQLSGQCRDGHGYQ